MTESANQKTSQSFWNKHPRMKALILSMNKIKKNYYMAILGTKKES